MQLIPKTLQCLCKDLRAGGVPLETVTSHPTFPGWEGELSQIAPVYSFSWIQDPQTCAQHVKETTKREVPGAFPRKPARSRSLLFGCYSRSQGQFYYFHFSEAKPDSDAV